MLYYYTDKLAEMYDAIQINLKKTSASVELTQTRHSCQNSPLTLRVTKISFPPFFAPQGPLTPKRGEDTLGTRVRLHAKFGVNRPAGCREIVDRTKKHKCVSRTNTNPPFAFQTAFPRGTDFTVFLQGGSKSYTRCL